MLAKSHWQIRCSMIAALAVLSVARHTNAQAAPNTGISGTTTTGTGTSGTTSAFQSLPSQAGSGGGTSTEGGAATGNRLRHAIAVEQGTVTITGTTQLTHQPNFFARAFEQIVLSILNSFNQGIGTLGNSVTGGRLGLSGLSSNAFGNTSLLGGTPLGTSIQQTTTTAQATTGS